MGEEERKLTPEQERWRDMLNDEPAIKGSAFTEMCDEIKKLRAEVARCHERLEVDHYFQFGSDDVLERVEVTDWDERRNLPDAVTCRDETIRLLEDDR